MMRFPNKVTHPLVSSSDGVSILNHPKLQQWSVHTSLSQLVQDVNAQLCANPPVAQGGYGAAPSYNAQQAPAYGWGRGVVNQPKRAGLPNLNNYGPGHRGNQLPPPGYTQKAPPSYGQRPAPPTYNAAPGGRPPAPGYHQPAPVQAPAKGLQPPAAQSPIALKNVASLQRADSLLAAMPKPEIKMAQIKDEVTFAIIEYTEDEIKEIAGDRERCLDLVLDNDTLQGYNSFKASTREGLLSAARKNQEEQAELEQLVQEVVEVRGEMSGINEKLTELNARQNAVNAKFSAEAIVQALGEAVDEAEAQAEEILERFGDEDISMPQFTKTFMKAKQLAHLRRIKQERLNVAMSS